MSTDPDTAHAWMPSSPCGDGCLPADPAEVSIVTVVLRWMVVGLILVSAPFLAMGGILPQARRARLRSRYARVLLRCVGLRLRVEDRRDRRVHDGGVLVVAGHVSWTDVLVLTAITPACFVARGDLLEWRVLGSLARRMRVIPIDRQHLRALPDTVGVTAERLRVGERVVAFPEGTTWCGRAYGGFRPAMFQAAIDAQCPVQPVALRYRDADGLLTTGPCFVGAETITESVRRLVRQRAVVADVVLAPLEWPGSDRRELADRCARAARGTGDIDLAAHSIVDPRPSYAAGLVAGR